MRTQPFDAERMKQQLEVFLTPLLEHSGLHLKFEIQNTAGHLDRDYENPDLVVDFSGADSPALLENKNELLRAIEQLALEVIGLEHDSQDKILFDCGEHRMMRFAELGLAAQAAAEKVRRTGVAYRFNGMSGRERRVIHMALRGDHEVHTESEGFGLNRQVVVFPKGGGGGSRRPGGAPGGAGGPGGRPMGRPGGGGGSRRR